MNIARLLFRLLLGQRLPVTSGTLEVSGISSPVFIRRDNYGIPYVEADNDDDAWYGLGFCQGQDRAFQIEMFLRTARGTVAEIVGHEAIAIDRLSRRIGFQRVAERQLEYLDDEILRMLQAFARGITDGARIGCHRQAHEFTLLRAKPSPYSATDVIGLAKLMSFISASGNWDVELARLKVIMEDGAEALSALDPTYPEWLPVTSPPGALGGNVINQLTEDLAIFMATIGQSGGSNNWVITSELTTTGRPILANDPHLSSSLPPYWYLAHVRCPNWTIAGASLTGTPVFPAGHNDTSAWGVTDGCVDSTDLFIEEIGPDAKSVRDGDQYVPCEIRSEIIRVKNGENIEEEILVTPRGPIVGPALEGEIRAISLSATWLVPKPTKGFISLHRTHTFEEFRDVFRHWPFASYNMVYADTSGTIGWQLVGETPKRRKGWGTIPLAGWDPEAGWGEDPIPFDEMPYLENPKTGFIATANNKPIQDNQGPFLGVDWLDGYRQARIVEALAANNNWDLSSVQEMQIDQKSLPWQELRDIVLAILGKTEEVNKALVLLKTWDGVVAADSPAASLFEFFLAEMIQRVVEAKAPRSVKYALGDEGFTPLFPYSMFLGRRVGHIVHLIREEPEGWFRQSWPEEMAAALTTAVSKLQKDYGENHKRWAWGRVRPLILSHPAGNRWPLNRVFNLGPFPWGGDVNTVGQAGGHISNPARSPLYIASLRMVIDVGNWEENRFALPGGQSGNPLSPHYDDLLPFWQQGTGVPIAWSSQEVTRVAKSTLYLKPR